jgi:hypothetical protein
MQVCDWVLNFYTLISQNCEDHDRRAVYCERATTLINKMTQNLTRETNIFDEKRQYYLKVWHQMKKLGICTQAENEAKLFFMNQKPKTAHEACIVFDSLGYGNYAEPQRKYLSAVLNQLTEENLTKEISVHNAHDYL